MTYGMLFITRSTSRGAEIVLFAKGIAEDSTSMEETRTVEEGEVVHVRYDN